MRSIPKWTWKNRLAHAPYHAAVTKCYRVKILPVERASDTASMPLPDSHKMQEKPRWQRETVKSPHLIEPVEVVAAKDIPYFERANSRQSLNIYLLKTAESEQLLDKTITALPRRRTLSSRPSYYVHIHGGAWRDPFLTSASIEAAVAHVFSDRRSHPIIAVASLNYSLSAFPTHSTAPYDPIKNNHSDVSREAVHPQHVSDVYSGFDLLRTLGLTDGSFVLSGHSAGSCLAFQSILQPPSYYGLDIPEPPVPAAMLGMNGLYDLRALVHDLGPKHQHLSEEYRRLQGLAFGADENEWAAASPACIDPDRLGRRLAQGNIPKLVLLDQSVDDQLVPMNEVERMEANLRRVKGLTVVRGKRCVGTHAAPWEQGYMIWESVVDLIDLLKAL